MNIKRTVFGLLILVIPILAFSQQTINGTIIHDDLVREYILYVPESYSSEIPAPLIFNFHGYTSNAFDQMLYGDFRSIADSVGFLVVHPMGTKDNSGNTHWNVGWGGSTVDDVGFTEALIDSLTAEWNINNDRVYSTGMSNGGFMSYLLACELSNRIAAIASVTGSMNTGQFNQCFPQHPMPVMEIHGTADIVVPYNGANWIESIPDIMEYWAGFNNCNPDPAIIEVPDYNPNDGSTVDHHIYSGGDNGVKVEHFKVLGGGHTWPGTVFGGSGTNYDINASEEIWEFFSRYDINGLIISTEVDEQNEVTASIKVYPNPANHFVIIENTGSESFAYQLIDPYGRTINTGVCKSKKQRLDISKLPEGIYLLKAGSIYRKILIVD